MKKQFYPLAIACAVVTLATSCSSDNDPIVPETPEVTAVGAYVINTGNWNANNGTIQWFDLETESVGGDLFRAANSSDIGDPQSMQVYGSKRYIACTSSAKIEVVDESCKVIKTLSLTNDQNQPVNPRYLTAAEGFVYFTAQDGSLSKLDTTSLAIVNKLQLGDYPEALTYANGKIYVNQSYYYTMSEGGNTVSVVDAATFTKIKEISIKLNPYTQCVTGEDGNIYVVSNGNYAGDPYKPEAEWVYQTVQRINTTTDAVTELCKGTYIALKGGKMYVLYAEYYLPETHRIFTYDLVTGAEENLPIELSQFQNPTFLTLHPITGDLYIGDAPYSSNGDLYIYNESGAFKKRIETGISPQGMYFVTE
ncbi:MAG: YncE family protein [Phocaeicola sp.]